MSFQSIDNNRERVKRREPGEPAMILVDPVSELADRVAVLERGVEVIRTTQAELNKAQAALLQPKGKP